MPELFYGLGNGSSLNASSHFNSSISDEVTFENVDVLYSLFEVNMEQARSLIPVSLHPSIPALMGVTIWHAKSSPIGPFAVAFTALACRTGIKPRHLVLNAYANSNDAQTFFAQRYGFDCRLADVRFRESYDRFYGAVYNGEKCLLETETTDSQPLVGGGVAVKYSPALNATTTNGEKLLVQIEVGYDFKRAARGIPKLSQYVGPIRAQHPVSGTHAICDMHFMPARFSVDLKTPAEAGGAKKLKQ